MEGGQLKFVFRSERRGWLSGGGGPRCQGSSDSELGWRIGLGKGGGLGVGDNSDDNDEGSN